MRRHTVFCSATDREVTLVARSGELPLALLRGEVACLDNGVRCTGTACPICAARLTAAERSLAGHPAPEA
jgi:hypothetical protein